MKKTKVCMTCGLTKQLHEFKKTKHGYGRKCKECYKEYLKEYQQRNKDKLKEYRELNKQKRKEYMKEFHIKNIEKEKKYRKKRYSKLEIKIKAKAYKKSYYSRQGMKEKRKEYNKEYRELNKQKINEQTRIYRSKKRKVDINYRIVSLLRSRLTKALKNQKVIKSKMQRNLQPYKSITKRTRGSGLKHGFF
jgi:hypothetical protein